MDRQVVYVGAIPLDTDQLLQTRNTMVALGYLTKMTIGDCAGFADGFECTPGSGLTVIVGPGSMTLPTTIDSSPYGALPPDGDPLIKIGINTGSTIVALPASGDLIISGGVIEIAGGSAPISYYNAANPVQTLIGPQGNGQAQTTVIQQRVVFAVTASANIPSGYLPLWQVSLPAGSMSVSAGMISLATGAPFLRTKLPEAAPLLSPTFVGNPTAPTALVGDTSSTLATTAFVSLATTRNRAAWGTGGSYSWACPSGVSTVLVRAWSAGGTGGSSSSGFPGGGGGGGGYIEVLINVTGGTTYSIQIGTGTGGSTSTSFDSRVVVAGGGNGQAGSAGLSGAGGSSGAPTTNNINSIASIGVSSGQSGYQTGGVNVGGGGGSSFGIAGAPVCFGGVNGSGGTWPGGGGAGGANGNGGSGADGLMVIEWNG